MENFNDTKKEGLAINQMGIELLGKAASWAKFLAVIMYICVAFIILAVLGILAVGSSMAGAFGGMSAGLIAFIYIIMGAFYLVFAMYLSKFASKAKLAISMNNTDMLTESLKGLKGYFSLQGILMIIGIVGGFFGGIIGAIGAASAF